MALQRAKHRRLRLRPRRQASSLRYKGTEAFRYMPTAYRYLIS
jgi:hypothetical protein